MRKPNTQKPMRKKTVEMPSNLPQHNFEEPFSDLLTAGELDDADDVLALALKIAMDHGEKGARQLADIAGDDTFDAYEAFYENLDDFYRLDKRWAARANAVLVLSMMPQHSGAVLDKMLDQLDSADELVVETLPAYFANVGEPALKPLIEVLSDTEEQDDTRATAADCLAEIAVRHPDKQDSVISVLQAQLIRAEDEPSLNTQLVSALLDLGSVDSIPIIFNAFRSGLIDPELLSIDEVEAHLKIIANPPIDRLAIYEKFGYDPDEMDSMHSPDAMDDIEESDSSIAGVPYIGEVKAGRNDPCPCGSGKKYKKCCGSAV